MKFSSQILKFFDPSMTKTKKTSKRPKSILKKEESIPHQQVFYLDFSNNLSSEPKKSGKNNVSKIGENNQVLLLNTIGIIINSLKMKVAVHNHLNPNQKVQVIDRLEIKPEMVALLGHQCKVAPCYDVDDQKSASLKAFEK